MGSRRNWPQRNAQPRIIIWWRLLAESSKSPVLHREALICNKVAFKREITKCQQLSANLSLDLILSFKVIISQTFSWDCPFNLFVYGILNKFPLGEKSKLVYYTTEGSGMVYITYSIHIRFSSWIHLHKSSTGEKNKNWREYSSENKKKQKQKKSGKLKNVENS
jgi:hypothetical protein